MDRGAWWHPLQGVTKSHTGVSWHTLTQVSHSGTQTDKKFAISTKFSCTRKRRKKVRELREKFIVMN